MHISSLIVHERMQQLGWPLLAGGALVLLGLSYGVSLVPQWQQLQALREQDQQAVLQLQQVKRGERKVVQSAEDPLQDLHNQLPAQPAATEAIERIYSLARSEQITLARGEYSLGVDPKTQLARYQILLPLRGTYPQIRRFLQALLGQMPGLVLEDIDLQRKRIGDTELTGRVRMTLYLSRS